MSQYIKELPKDTLVLWGRNDDILDSKFAERFAEDLPQSRLVLMEDCGHCIHLEKPAEMASLVADFAKQLSGPSKAVQHAARVP